MIALALFAVGAIKGHVIDTTQVPVRGALVEIVGSSISARTDSAGAFRMIDVPVGRQIVHVGHVALAVDVKADTAVEIVLMARNVAAPHIVWLGCQPFGTCGQMRFVATLRDRRIPAGVGVIRDATTWLGFVSRHATGSDTVIRHDVIDWTHEMLVIVSYGGINRVESHPDRLTVLLGPDSVSGTPVSVTDWTPATVIAVKRTTLPVEYHPILPTTHVPPAADWSAQ